LEKVERQIEFSVAGEYPDAAAFAWSPDSRQIAVLARLQRYATVFDAASGRPAARFDDLVGGGTTIDFDREGRVLLPPRDVPGGLLMVWDQATGRTLPVWGVNGQPRPPSGHPLHLFSLDRARSFLLGLHQAEEHSGSAFRMILYDARTWTIIGSGASSATALALSPDGARAAAAEQGRVTVLELPSGRPLLRIEASRNDVQHVAWSADGRRLVTGTMGRGFGRDPATGAYGPRIDKDVLQMWDSATGQRVAAASIDVGGGVESVDFSSDGRWLATTTSDGACRLWDAVTLRPVATVAEGLHPTTALARFSPDSRRLAVLRTGLAMMALYDVP
jgi:WD40 repeat protein